MYNDKRLSQQSNIKYLAKNNNRSRKSIINSISVLVLVAMLSPALVSQAFAGASAACVNGAGLGSTLECGNVSSTGASNTSTAIGTLSSARSTGSVSLGYSAGYNSGTGITDSPNAIAIGNSSNIGATSSGAIAIGGDLDADSAGAEANDDSAIALGADAKSNSQEAIAIGSRSNISASSRGAIAIGGDGNFDDKGAEATDDGAIALGADAMNSGLQAIAIGQGTINDGSFSTSIGSFSQAHSEFNVSLGFGAGSNDNVPVTDSPSSIAIGHFANIGAASPGAIAIGGDLSFDLKGAEAVAPGAIALGSDVFNDVANSMKVAVPLRIENDQGTAEIKVVETNATSANRQLLNLENNGGIGMRMNNTNNGSVWDFNNTNSGNFTASKVGTGGFELEVQGNGRMKVRTFGTLIMDMRADGNLHIPEGDVIVSGTTLSVPDYVFEHDYKLMPLDELKGFVTKNKHLPNVASEAEIKKSKQVSMAKSHMRHLEKIEELTLYTIQQHEQISSLKSELDERTTALKKILDDQNITLKAENSSLKDRLASLEKLVTNLAMSSDKMGKGDKVALK